MFLTRLRLRDVRAHVELDLRFTREDGSVRPWTFLLGENGVGKSTVVRALALVLAGSDALGLKNGFLGFYGEIVVSHVFLRSG